MVGLEYQGTRLHEKEYWKKENQVNIIPGQDGVSAKMQKLGMIITYNIYGLQGKKNMFKNIGEGRSSRFNTGNILNWFNL